MNAAPKRMASLTPENASIFRIMHRDNLPWILDHGLHCASSALRDPKFIEIGNSDLIQKRAPHPVPMPPHGTIADYVAFYFTPCSPMLLNIVTGRRGVTRREKEEIVICVSSLHRLKADDRQFVFTDRHAYVSAAQFSKDLKDVGRLNWEDLQNRDFSSDTERLDKMEKYMAEALVYKHLPLESLEGIACYNEITERSLREQVASRGLNIKIKPMPGWYFP